MARKPKGVLARPTPDWYSSGLMGFHIVQNSVAGQNSYVGVFNGTPNQSFYVYQVLANLSGSSSYIFFETYKGNPGTTYTDNVPIGVVDPRLGVPALTPIAFTEAACLGLHVGGFPGNAAQYISPSPLIIAPPGYSALVQTRNAAVTIEATIYGCLVDD